VHYPDYSARLAARLREQPEALGLALCGSGVGIAIGLVKHGVPCMPVCHPHHARLALAQGLRALALGERQVGREVALDILKLMLG
jgi:ribose 5-phosphate isomerase B